jgi:single-strand DNA-binding protein
VLQLELTVPRLEEKAESVPVVWFDAPPRAMNLDVDQEVLVVGRVRRRFFRSGGATQSRTEVVAEEVLPTRMVKKVAAAINQARFALEELDPAREREREREAAAG